MLNIPISRVCVFNCEAIGVINDAVGGVEVTIENDFTDESGEVLEPEFYKGNTLKLTGEQAVIFIIPGEVKMGEEFEEYHTDSTALKKIVLENFYTKVK